MGEGAGHSDSISHFTEIPALYRFSSQVPDPLAALTFQPVSSERLDSNLSFTLSHFIHTTLMSLQS